MTITVPQTDALDLARNNYQEYSLYIASGRAYPNLLDGAKSVQKRIIYSLDKKAPRSIIKVAEAAGYCLDMHPHPTAVPEVIVSLGDNGNKFNFLEKQGNFGHRAKNIEASAPRYIGCKLSDLAIALTCDGIEYCPTMTGELDKPEPIALPTLLPLCFLNSMSGIPAGLPKLNIPSLDIVGMFDYYLDVLKHKDLNYVPKKLPIPNVGVPILSSKAGRILFTPLSIVALLAACRISFPLKPDSLASLFASRYSFLDSELLEPVVLSMVNASRREISPPF